GYREEGVGGSGGCGRRPIRREMLREKVDAFAQSSPNFQRGRRLPKDNSNAKSCLRGSRDSESLREPRALRGCRSRPRNGTSTIPKSRRREPRLKQARMPQGRRLSSICSLTRIERGDHVGEQGADRAKEFSRDPVNYKTKRDAEDGHYHARLPHHLIGIVADSVKELVRGAPFLRALPAAIVQRDKIEMIEQQW